MKDSRSGSYATMGGAFWAVAKCAAIAHLASPTSASVWALGASVGAGPAMVVAQATARATAAPLLYFFDYVVDDEDAKGEYYNWFGESRRLLGLARVAAAFAFAAAVSLAVLPPHEAVRALAVVAVATPLAGFYGQSIIGGVMGDFLGCTICIAEVCIYLALAAEFPQVPSPSEAEAAAEAAMASTTTGQVPGWLISAAARATAALGEWLPLC